MSRLQSIERQLGLHKQPEKIPAPETSGLGAAIQEIIDRAVQQQVKDALADREHQNPRVRSMMRDFEMRPEHTDFKQVPAPARTAPSVAREIQFQRDKLGRINIVTVGFMAFNVQRGNDGKIVALLPADIAQPTPAVEPAPLNKA